VKSAIVIGSGIAGLAIALRLRKKGFEVSVFEAGDKPGGKLGQILEKEYRWDTGPSLFTMPHLVDELFELIGENPTDFFNYEKKETVCNYFWEDGTFFSANHELTRFINDACSVFNVEKKHLEKYLENSAFKYHLTAPLFIEKSLHKASTFLNKDALKAIKNIIHLDLFKTLDQVNNSYFKDPRLVQLFNRFATYNGSSPYSSPGILSMIPTLEMQYGTYFPKGGMRVIVDSLYDLANRNGIRFHFNEKVTEITVENSIATGILTEKNTYKANTVVSNMDIYLTYRYLLKDFAAPEKILNQERSSSALIFYWGIKKEFKELDLHNIFFSKDYQSEFKALFETKTISEDPTIYVNISSKNQKQDAPKDSENWFVMVNAPSNIGQDWKQFVSKTKALVIAKLNRILNVSLENLIEVERTLDPIMIEENTGSYQGSLYGTSSNSKSAAFMRHPNFSHKIKNLYFCGGSVHPGGGIPLCLQSAKITANLID
tara:strand:- start:23456 stop:24916 length:1461 start_codon:yes stop_codon:yes gene_type:complete